MHDTMHQFMDKDKKEYWDMVSNDRFLLESIMRGIFSSIFLVFGWTLIGLIAKTTIFSSTTIKDILDSGFFGSRVKRKRRFAHETGFRDFLINTDKFSHVQNAFPMLNSEESSVNEQLIEKSFENIINKLTKWTRNG